MDSTELFAAKLSPIPKLHPPWFSLLNLQQFHSSGLATLQHHIESPSTHYTATNPSLLPHVYAAMYLHAAQARETLVVFRNNPPQGPGHSKSWRVVGKARGKSPDLPLLPICVWWDEPTDHSYFDSRSHRAVAKVGNPWLSPFSIMYSWICVMSQWALPCLQQS